MRISDGVHHSKSRRTELATGLSRGDPWVSGPGMPLGCNSDGVSGMQNAMAGFVALGRRLTNLAGDGRFDTTYREPAHSILGKDQAVVGGHLSCDIMWWNSSWGDC